MIYYYNSPCLEAKADLDACKNEAARLITSECTGQLCGLSCTQSDVQSVGSCLILDQQHIRVTSSL
jgi:hypothetical protein